MRGVVALLAFGLAVSACAQTIDPEKHGPPIGGSAGAQGPGGNSGASSGGASGTAGSSGSSGGGSSGSTGTGGSGGSSGNGTGGSSGTTGMDPGLVLPDPNGTLCTHYGTNIGCSNLEVCRIYDHNSGRCETCDTCGNLDDYCVTDRDCDILFQCYEHICTNICPLGTSYCGAVSDCVDVGNDTYGVCKP